MVSRSLVIEAQAGLNASRQNAGPESTRSAPGDPALEKELDPIGTANVEVVTDDLLEKLAATQGTVEDLCEADLHLKDRELVLESGFSVSAVEGMWQPLEPFAEEDFDVLRTELFAIAVEIEAVDAFDLEGDVVAE